MKVWFTSDTHFGSERTLELSKRPFRKVRDMDDAMVRNWNFVVNKDDTVYHLGDFGTYETAKRLNGNIVLLSGNYEEVEITKDFNGIFTKFRDKIKEEYGITLVRPTLDILVDDIILYLTHGPSRMKTPLTENEFNLFGHIHALQKVKRSGLNVGVDCHHFKPINMDTVRFYMNAIKNFYDEEVFMDK